MSSFDEHEKAEEIRWKHNEEIKFRVLARRNKLLGLWAAERLGLAGSDAEIYAKEIVITQVGKEGENNVLNRVLTDLTVSDSAVDETVVRNQMKQFLTEAKGQILR